MVSLAATFAGSGTPRGKRRRSRAWGGL